MRPSEFAVLVAISTILFTPFSASAQTVRPGACLLAPSFCELRGKTLDAERCRCVTRRTSNTICLLLPLFCEINGQTLDTERCMCVTPYTPAKARRRR